MVYFQTLVIDNLAASRICVIISVCSCGGTDSIVRLSRARLGGEGTVD